MANSDMIVRVQADTKNYDANLAKASKTLKQFADNNLSMGGILKQSTGALTGMAASVLSVTAAIGAAKKVMSDMININKAFEQGTANLASIMGQSREEIVKLTNQAKQLGAATRYTAMQITELQTNLARLGFTQQEILNSTTAVQALATATGADLGEAANLAGAALRGFGLNATEMERVASVLAVSTTKSALSFDKLATAVPIVAPVAKQFGFTIEDTVTLLGKLSDAGMDASTAATATRNIFLKMANDSGKLAQALGRPVHSVEEFGEALAEMRKKGMSLNDILQMVGVRSTAAFAVFADNAETLKDFKQSITDCGDAMHDMESKQIDTLQGSLIILNSAWEGLMLSFNESTGPIKTAVDALTELLQAWTKWRNRNQGGDAAIQSYELGLTDEQKRSAEMLYKGYKAGGTTDEQIKKMADDAADALIKQRDAAKKLYDELEKIKKFTGNEHDSMQAAWNKRLHKLFPEYNVRTDGAAPNYLARQLAGMNDKIAYQEYLGSLAVPAAVTEDPTKTDEQLQKRKEQYEMDAKAAIAALDRKKLGEEKYEAEVYQIKRTALEQIAKLYNEDSKEYARAMAKKYDLDIQHQAAVLRFANKEEKKSQKYQTLTGPSGYSQEGISALRSEIQTAQKSMQIGSAEYIIEANRLVDLATFENLLKNSIQKGVEIDPSTLETLFESIDLSVDIKPEEWQALVANINEQLAALNLDPIKLDVDTGNLVTADKQVKSTTTAWQAAASAVATVGSALQQIEDPTAKIAGIIAQAIAQIALTFATSLKGTIGPWDWIAAATAGTATMISTITAIKAVTDAGKFAGGGVVGGSSYSGDNLIAHVNSGETILSAAQSDRVASMLTSNPFDNLQLSMAIDGTKFLVLLNNVNRQRGGSRNFYTERH